MMAATSRVPFPRCAGCLRSAMCGVVCLLLVCCVVPVFSRLDDYQPVHVNLRTDSGESVVVTYSTNLGDSPVVRQHTSHKRRHPPDSPNHLFRPGDHRFSFHGSPHRTDFSGRSHVRHRRAVTYVNLITVQTQETVNVSTTAVSLINFRTSVTTPANDVRDFTLVSVVPENARSLFTLSDQGSLLLKAGKNLDYETFKPGVNFTVHAVLRSNTQDVVAVTAFLQISDMNEGPVFTTEPQPYQAVLRTTSSSGSNIITLNAVDPEEGIVVFNKISVIPVTFNDRVEIIGNGNQCELRTTSAQVFTSGDKFTITVGATDNTQIETRTSVEVSVGLRVPQIFQTTYEGTLMENTMPSQTVLLAGSTNSLQIKVKKFQSDPVTLSLKDGGSFSINNDGYISYQLMMDYELPGVQKTTTLTVVATQVVSSTILTSTALVSVEFLDINDNPPVFTQSQYLTTIKEDFALDYSITNLAVEARDKDSGVNGEIVYSIQPLNDTDFEYFDIITTKQVSISGDVSYKGIVRVQKRLDFDRQKGPFYSFVVQAADKGSPSLSSTSSVRITATNVNDEKPDFLQPSSPGAKYSVNETDKAGKVVMQIQAVDKDGDNVKYYFEGMKGTVSKFSINNSTGVISLTSDIINSDDRFLLNITARDDGSCCGFTPQLSQDTFVYVQVEVSNKAKPSFESCLNYATHSVNESSPINTTVIQVTATDTDRGDAGRITYQLTRPTDIFDINSQTGWITVKSIIDREGAVGDFVQVTVQARDNGYPTLEGWCTFRLTVNDINDNAPVFDRAVYQINITLAVQTNQAFYALRATDSDVGINAQIFYSIGQNPNDTFGIISDTGFIYLKNNLIPSVTQYNLTVMAKDQGLQPLNSTVVVIVNVQPGNTAKLPQWGPDPTIPTVSESVQDGFYLVNMSCTSNIEGKPGVEFQLISQPGEDYFSLVQDGSNSMNLYAKGKFDYLKNKSPKVDLRCLNFGSPSLIVTKQFTFNLTDTNNQAPVFQGLTESGRYSSQIPENMPAGTSVITITASDADSTIPFNTVTFSLTASDGNFSLQSLEGNTAVLRTGVMFDREKSPNYFVSVRAVDGAPSVLPSVRPNPNSVTVNVEVQITDVNDNPPKFNQTSYIISVKENYYVAQGIENRIFVSDLDSSDSGRHQFRVSELSGSISDTFNVRSSSGSGIPIDSPGTFAELYLTRKLDYEGKPPDTTFVLLLTALDYNSVHSSTATVTINVEDVNDNNPEFEQSIYYVDNITENDNDVPRVLLTLSATDKDINRPSYIQYGLRQSEASSSFSINETSGEFSVTMPLDREAFASYQVSVFATDEQDSPNFGYATVIVRPQDVNDNKPEFKSSLEASVPEHSSSGTSVVQLLTEDKDAGENGKVRYSLTSVVDGNGTNCNGYFIVDEITGAVRTNTTPDKLDREVMDNYKLSITLRDLGSPPLTNSGVLTVTLSDINDQSPRCVKKQDRQSMFENLDTGGPVTQVLATDADIGENADIFYALPNAGDTKNFKILTNGVIVVYQRLDYEQADQRFFNLTVKVEDKAGHNDTCYIAIDVLDFNDNVPEIVPTLTTTSISESVQPGTWVANFSATDKDSGINKEFAFSIARSTNLLNQFAIDPAGVVRVRRALDRETTSFHVLTIQAIDKGNPPLTGTATLSVTVLDVNDNYPMFKENYHPQIKEEEGMGTLREVQVILAKDPDADPFGSPFGFRMQCPTGLATDCDKFTFQFNPAGDGGNGLATIRTDRQFDRETQKYYYLPIVMWDMYNKNDDRSMTGTNTLTVTIADINDNPMSSGHQDMFVYNYKGQFDSVEIGRVYVQDKDDWDLPDKTFTFLGPEWLKSYFTVNTDTGMVTMRKGVPSNKNSAAYSFSVSVYDKIFQSTVTSSVSVVVEDLSEEAVRNSGAVRIKGTSAEQFIRPQSGVKSAYEQFRALMAQKLNTATENVQIVSVQDVSGDMVDVRYAVHGSPYYPSSQSDSIVALNKKEFEGTLPGGASIAEVPIDACAQEIFEGGCYNFMNITGKPALVNTNGSSFVGVEVFIVAMAGCRALNFPEPNECSGDYCYHDGICVKDKFGVLSCQNCSKGFDGPRCQQLKHSFDGKSYTMYSPLEQCEDSETSIEFITTQSDGLLLYNGPMGELQPGQPQDFIGLELHGGYPVLNIDHGSGALTLTINGRDSSNDVRINTLADGKWHKIDIIRKGKYVEMIVDDCRVAAPSGSNMPDTSPCRNVGNTVGDNTFLNVGTLLQVGGLATTLPSRITVAVAGAKFNGCVRNLIHNSKYYDLHYKATPSVPSGTNGCPQEKGCDNVPCVNGVCSSTFTASDATCVCNAGWRGSSCDTATTVRDLKTSSYLQWQLKAAFPPLPTYELDIQVQFRTYDDTGVLFTVASPADATKNVILEIKDRYLQATFNLGSGDKTLHLDNSEASNGQWHIARFRRVMYVASLTMDNGEGRNHVFLRSELTDSVTLTINATSPMFAGAIVSNPQVAEVIDRDLTETCIQDLRLNGKYMPIKTNENGDTSIVSLTREKNVIDGCTRANGCVPPPICPSNTVCQDLWGKHNCICGPGYSANSAGTCMSTCTPNPCFHNVECQLNNGSVVCPCPSPWTGQLCNIYPTSKENDAVEGLASGAIAGIVIGIIVAVALVILVIVCLMGLVKKNRDDFAEKLAEEDLADIRESVMYYDEEGAGEEDQNVYDLGKLPMQNETMGRPMDGTYVKDVPVRRRPPNDRPDVGNVIHDRLDDADDDPEAPPFDTLITFNEEGGGSDAGSLSSLGSGSSDASQDYDYLNNWGPKFARLADMYGAGQEEQE